MTQRLYYGDSYLREFEANVLEVRPWGAHVAIVLDRTAFYPTSGGQPHDLGTLDGYPLTDVVEDGEAILHVLVQGVTGRVRGQIEWPRRFDHMQQHTGQHILSQACLQALDAETLSVHFGSEVSTLDLSLATLEAAAVARMEELANTLVLEDRPVHVYEVDAAAASSLGVRRPTTRAGRIRIVEIEGFDRSACGGTHVRRTGEVGTIKVRRWERGKGGVRAEFLCGWRALRDYQWKHALVAELAARFTVKDREVGEAVTRMAEQMRASDRVLADLRDRILAAEARDRLQSVAGSPKIIAEVVADREAGELVSLAGHMVAAASAVVLLGTVAGKLVFARSADVPVDVGALVRRIAQAAGGQGGGRPQFAQGAVTAAAVADVVRTACAEVKQLLAAGPP